MKTILAREDGQRQAEEGNVRLNEKTAFFYKEEGLVASTNPGWIQSEFYIVTGIFDRVRLRKNIRKTVGMV